MDPRTGEIHHFELPEDLKNKEKELERLLIPLTQDQVKTLEPMGAKQRKGWMRNHPCVCGSGKKFKKCCWDKFDNTS